MATRGPTRAQLILAEAKERVNQALRELSELRLKADRAQAVYEAQLDAYNGLQAGLARRPKSKPAPKPAPAVAKKSLPASKSSVATAASIGISRGDASGVFNGIAGSSGDAN